MPADKICYLRVIYYSLAYCIRLCQQGMGESPISDKDGLNDFNVPIDTSIHPPRKTQICAHYLRQIEPIYTATIIGGRCSAMHILGQMWCGKEGGRAVAPQSSDTAYGLSLAHPLASSICLGLSESEQNPIFFLPSVAPILVLNNGAKSSVVRPRQ